MKNVLTVQDLSCVGKCSLTVALPVLSAMGCSCSVLPTAVLSTHTAFPDPHVRDLTADMRENIDHWRSIGAEFDGILVGYLSSPQQAHWVEYLWDRFDGLRILDPAMGDGGKLYSGMTAGNIIAMEQLCKKADVLIPNVTEACLLCGVAYEKGQDRAWHERLTEILLRKGCKRVVLTGVSLDAGVTGFLTSDGTLYQTAQLDGHYHGTGDLFAAVLTGALLGGESLQAAAEKAARFVEACIKSTGEYSRFGIRFEENLGKLAGN